MNKGIKKLLFIFSYLFVILWVGSFIISIIPTGSWITFPAYMSFVILFAVGFSNLICAIVSFENR